MSVYLLRTARARRDLFILEKNSLKELSSGVCLFTDHFVCTFLHARSENRFLLNWFSRLSLLRAFLTSDCVSFVFLIIQNWWFSASLQLQQWKNRRVNDCSTGVSRAAGKEVRSSWWHILNCKSSSVIRACQMKLIRLTSDLSGCSRNPTRFVDYATLIEPRERYAMRIVIAMLCDAWWWLIVRAAIISEHNFISSQHMARHVAARASTMCSLRSVLSSESPGIEVKTSTERRQAKMEAEKQTRMTLSRKILESKINIL